MEDKLIDLAKCTIRFVQIVGYLPITIQSNNLKSPQKTSSTSSLSLQFRIRSLSVLFTVILLTSCLVWETVFFTNLKNFLRYGFIKISGPTERYSHHFFVVGSSLMGILLRIAGLLNGRKTVDFWQSNCSTLDKVENLLGYTQGNLLEEKEYKNIKKALKRSIFITVGCIGIHAVCKYGQGFVLTLLSKNGWSTRTEFVIGAGFWNIFVLLHALNTTWLCFFIQLYSAGFKCIRKRIQSIEETEGYPGIIYISEVVRVKKIPGCVLEPYDGYVERINTKLVQCIDTFKILEQQVHQFNRFFGGRVILEVVNCITNLVFYSFFASVWIGRGNWTQVCHILVPFAVYASQLYSLGSVAGEMTLAAQQVSTALFEKVSLEYLWSGTVLKLQMLAMKIGNGPPVITARHFFTVNRHLVTSVLSAMTTFLVVLVQFKDSDEEGVPGFVPIFQQGWRSNVSRVKI